MVATQPSRPIRRAKGSEQKKGSRSETGPLLIMNGVAIMRYEDSALLIRGHRRVGLGNVKRTETGGQIVAGQRGVQSVGSHDDVVESRG
jgi:hypothetical protein